MRSKLFEQLSGINTHEWITKSITEESSWVFFQKVARKFPPGDFQRRKKTNRRENCVFSQKSIEAM